MACLQIARPGENELAQDHPPLDIARRARQGGIERIVEAGFVLFAVERAQRQNFGQQNGGIAALARKLHRQRPAGAPGRDEDRRLGQRQRARFARQAGNHPPVEQGAGEDL